MNLPLSSKDLYKALQKQVKIINWKKIKTYKDLDELLEPFDSTIILYEFPDRKNFGHWTCIFRDLNGVIEHFDSYGYEPDEELEILDKYCKERPHLVKLMYYSPYKLRYSHHKLQTHGSTCGRWVLMRLLLKNMDEDSFAKLFPGKNKDKQVYEATKKLFNI
jgi:hypothetical protein